MYAILRVNTYEPHKLAKATDRMEEFDQLHAAQPGAEGSIGVDLGQGRRFVLNLWESVESSRAGRQVLVPHLERLLVPLMSQPSEFLGAGPVETWQMAPTGRGEPAERDGPHRMPRR